MMNPFQKELTKKFKQTRKDLLHTLETEKEYMKRWREASKIGTEVVIDFQNRSYAIFNKKYCWQHSHWTKDYDSLLKMIEENGWVLIEQEVRK